jgi:hypothetical protein
MATNLQFIKSVSGTNVTTLSVTDCFKKGYDIYKITLNSESNSTDGYFGFQLIDNSSSIITGSEYHETVLALRSYNTFIENRSATASMVSAGYDQDFGATMVIYIYNPDDSSDFTFGNFQSSGGTSGNQSFGTGGMFVHDQAEIISGIHFKMSAGSNDFNYINVSVFGIR